jgi:hypothetical protein
MQEEMCHCGLPLHYASPINKEFVDRLIATLGPEVRVTRDGRSWMVPRHYIALHGLAARDLPNLGFREVTGAPQTL